MHSTTFNYMLLIYFQLHSVCLLSTTCILFSFELHMHYSYFNYFSVVLHFAWKNGNQEHITS